MALITDVGNVAGTGGILQPKLVNRWRLTFIGLGDGTDSLGMTVQAITFDRPKISIDRITLDRYNSRAYIAGKYTFEEINGVFEDDTGGRVTQALQNQFEKQQNIIGPYSSPLLPASPAGQLYKFAIRADILDGNETIFESWSYEGVWIDNLDYNQLDYAQSAALKVNVKFSIDHARQLNTGAVYKENSAFGGF